MRILIFLSHPAQYLFYRNTIHELKKKGHHVFVLTKTKDILTDLLDKDGLEYVNILPVERNRNKISIVWSLFKRNFAIYKFAKKENISLLLGSDASPAHVGFLLRIPSITTLEDDFKVIKSLAKLTYPVTSCILVPKVCDVGKWKYKKIGYDSYMKFAYLHPSIFKPCVGKIKNVQFPFYLIRLSSLNAHHDFGQKGVSNNLLDRMLSLLSKKGQVYITSERSLPKKYEPYRLNISISDIHHYLYYAQMLISDSQSMSVEASILGTPSIRVSSFAGEISVLQELESVYKLTFGIKPEKEHQILNKIEELITDEELTRNFKNRREKLLKEKINTSEFLTWFISNYPKSKEKLQRDPDFQYKFKN